MTVYGMKFGGQQWQTVAYFGRRRFTFLIFLGIFSVYTSCATIG